MELNLIFRTGSKLLARYLTKTVSRYRPFAVHRTDTLAQVMQPGDILLVEGDQRISAAIKYLTQSTWSHAAFFVGTPSSHADLDGIADGEAFLIEADLENGVIGVPLSKYSQYNIRICRPYHLADKDREALCNFMMKSIGMQYDLKNIVDLLRYLLPNPPVPRRWRRRMLALGSGDPTRVICSTLIAQAFQSIKYPILPEKICMETDDGIFNEQMHIRHHSLFTPRDFDISPYFQIIKPELQQDFDYTSLEWQQHSEDFLESGERDMSAQA